MSEDVRNREGPVFPGRRPPESRLSVTHPVIVAFLTVAFGVSVWLAYDVYFFGFGAVLVAVLLRTISSWIGSRVPSIAKYSLFITVLGLVLIVVGIGGLMAPSISDQFGQLADRVPQVLQEFSAKFQATAWGQRIMRILPENLGGNGGQILAGVGSFFTVTLDALVKVALLVVMGGYLAAESRRYRRGLLALVPEPKVARFRELLDKLAATLRWWLIGQMIAMVMLGAASFIGLRLLGIPLALALALFTALLTFVPNIGPILSTIPPVLLGLAESPTKALYVFLFYVLLQFFEGNFLTPLVQRRIGAIPPALLLFTQFLMAGLFGFWGLALAAPLTACIIVLVRMTYVEDTLGKTVAHEEPGPA